MKKFTFVSTVFAIAYFVSCWPVALASYGLLEISVDTTLTENHYGNIVIVEDNVILDCEDFTVQGQGSGSGVGILLNGRTGVTVTRCVVSGFDEGIVVENSHGNRINVNTVRENFASGIRLHSSQHNEITRNRVIDNQSEDSSGATALIIGQVSSNNLVNFNTVTGNESTGIVVADPGSDRNRIVANVSSYNGGHGFDIISVRLNTFRGNIAVDNGDVGFHVHGEAEFNSLTVNSACGNNTLDAVDNKAFDGGRGNFWFNNLFCTKQGF
ncbi:MAG: right-handed parallel beta-helix repeat-containing protein [Woeseiaceae bacterium]|nr:right-handed parallel beta-helix repeat-containing protein [Woeseiaceae bacterium]